MSDINLGVSDPNAVRAALAAPLHESDVEFVVFHTAADDVAEVVCYPSKSAIINRLTLCFGVGGYKRSWRKLDGNNSLIVRLQVGDVVREATGVARPGTRNAAEIAYANGLKRAARMFGIGRSTMRVRRRYITVGTGDHEVRRSPGGSLTLPPKLEEKLRAEYAQAMRAEDGSFLSVYGPPLKHLTLYEIEQMRGGDKPLSYGPGESNYASPPQSTDLQKASALLSRPFPASAVDFTVVAEREAEDGRKFAKTLTIVSRLSIEDYLDHIVGPGGWSFELDTVDAATMRGKLTFLGHESESIGSGATRYAQDASAFRRAGEPFGLLSYLSLKPELTQTEPVIDQDTTLKRYANGGQRTVLLPDVVATLRQEYGNSLTVEAVSQRIGPPLPSFEPAPDPDRDLIVAVDEGDLDERSGGDSVAMNYTSDASGGLATLAGGNLSFEAPVPQAATEPPTGAPAPTTATPTQGDAEQPAPEPSEPTPAPEPSAAPASTPEGESDGENYAPDLEKANDVLLTAIETQSAGKAMVAALYAYGYRNFTLQVLYEAMGGTGPYDAEQDTEDVILLKAAFLLACGKRGMTAVDVNKALRKRAKKAEDNKVDLGAMVKKLGVELAEAIAIQDLLDAGLYDALPAGGAEVPAADAATPAVDPEPEAPAEPTPAEPTPAEPTPDPAPQGDEAETPEAPADDVPSEPAAPAEPASDAPGDDAPAADEPPAEPEAQPEAKAPVEPEAESKDPAGSDASSGDAPSEPDAPAADTPSVEVKRQEGSTPQDEMADDARIRAMLDVADSYGFTTIRGVIARFIIHQDLEKEVRIADGITIDQCDRIIAVMHLANDAGWSDEKLTLQIERFIGRIAELIAGGTPEEQAKTEALAKFMSGIQSVATRRKNAREAEAEEVQS